MGSREILRRALVLFVLFVVVVGLLGLALPAVAGEGKDDGKDDDKDKKKVPEPASLLLLGSGLTGLVYLGTRWRNRING